MKKPQDYPAFPNTYEPERFTGLTYRQWMAGQIAGHMAGNNIFHEELTARMTDSEETLRMFGLSIWVLTDAILDTENAPREQHKA